MMRRILDFRQPRRRKYLRFRENGLPGALVGLAVLIIQRRRDAEFLIELMQIEEERLLENQIADMRAVRFILLQAVDFQMRNQQQAPIAHLQGKFGGRRIRVGKWRRDRLFQRCRHGSAKFIDDNRHLRAIFKNLDERFVALRKEMQAIFGRWV